MEKVQNNFIKTLSILGIFLAAFFLPLKTSWSNIGLIILIASTIFSFFMHGFDRGWIKRKQVYYTTPIILFIPIFLGMFYAPGFEEAWNELSKSVFLLLVPLVVFRRDKPEINLYKYAGIGLVTGVAICVVYLLTLNFYAFSTSDYPFRSLFNYTFTSGNFLKPLGEDMHTLYLGSYFVLALAFLAFGKMKIPKILRVILAILILMSIVFVSSRIIYFSAFLVCFLFALEKLSWKAFSISVAVLLVAVAASFPFFQKTYVYNKAIEGTVWQLTPNIGTPIIGNTADSRMSRWLVAWELIEEQPLIGYGTGMEDALLMKKYRAYDMQNSIEEGYNSHNQFLGFLINYGMVGTFFLILYFATNSYRSFKWKDLNYISFLIILGTLCLVENYLDRNMGLNFVALFGTLFYLKNQLKHEKKSNSHDLSQNN